MSNYNSGPAAVNPMMESPYIPSSESAHSGRSSSPEHPGERVADSNVHLTSMAMQYVNHANMNTTGYAYAEHGRLHGVTDVDVDEKPHLVYESMTEVQHQARQRMMNGGHVKPNVEAGGDKYAGVPNAGAKRNKVRGTTYQIVKVIWNLFLAVLAVGAFGLSVYNFLNKDTVFVENLTNPTSQPSQAGGENVSPALFEELNNTVNNLKEMLNMVSSVHETRYSELNTTIFTAIESVQSVSASNELDLTFGCVEREAECVVSRQGNSPQFAFCETDTEDLTVEGFTNVNIYCSVDNAIQETNPITSTLNIYAGQITCLCNVLDYSTSSLMPTCRLHVRRCPNTIQLNTTNMP